MYKIFHVVNIDVPASVGAPPLDTQLHISAYKQDMQTISAMLSIATSLHCTLQPPQHNSLPMHINMHSTTYHTAFHIPPLHTTNKHKEYLSKWQHNKGCRDGVKVLWCHSHLVWLVFEGHPYMRFIQKTFGDLYLSNLSATSAAE